jgi:hypothetical protein
MAYNRDLARRNIAVTIKRTEEALAAPAPERPIFPGARASLARALDEARDAQQALNDGECPEGWA